MSLGSQKFVSITTFRKTGVPVATPTWIVPLDEGRVGFWTSSASGKFKRLRNNPQVTLQPCDQRGRLKLDSTVSSGTATLVTAGPEFESIQRQIKAKYGMMVRVSRVFNTLGHIGKGASPYGDVVVVVSLLG